MSLITRIAGIPETGQSPEDVRKLGFETVLAWMGEIDRGHRTASEAHAALSLSIAEQQEFDTLTALYAGRQSNAKERYLQELREIFSLAETRGAYQTEVELMARIDQI